MSELAALITKFKRKVVGEDNRVFEKEIPACGVSGLGQLNSICLCEELHQLTPALGQQIELGIPRNPCLMGA